MNEKQSPKLIDLFKNKTISEGGSSDVHHRNHDLMNRWREAKEKKLLVLSDRIEERKGLKADWGMFDFLLGAYGPKFPQQMSFLDNLMFFWSVFWPHLETNIRSYERISESYEMSVEEERQTMVDWANQNWEIQVLKDYLEKTWTKKEKMAFEIHRKVMKKEFERQQAKVFKQELKNDQTEETNDREIQGQTVQKGTHPQA